MITFEADVELWPQIRESLERNGQEEAFIAPFFAQLDEVTLALITPDGTQRDDVRYTFRCASYAAIVDKVAHARYRVSFSISLICRLTSKPTRCRAR